LPAGALRVPVAGGNHVQQMGWYGPQGGDGVASSREAGRSDGHPIAVGHSLPLLAADAPRALLGAVSERMRLQGLSA